MSLRDIHIGDLIIDLGEYGDQGLRDLLDEAELCVTRIEDEIDRREDEND